ncbi:MAG: ABC transporter substrate-binding protein [Bacilli bacterium]|nr:ABC transporter substrate-binding protein [Bacilli bacterium]
MKTKGKALVLVSSALMTLTACGGGGGKKESLFRLAKTWDKTGIRYHYNSGSNIGALSWFATEGLIQYVRTTDEYFFQLAESIDHANDHTSTIHLRTNAKWHDGSSFTADDVLAYYGMIYTTVSNHLISFPKKIDDYTVKLEWKPWMEPESSETKNLMIAQDKVGTVKYSIFKQYVDTAQNILRYQDDCTEKFVNYMGWAPYGKINDAEADALYNDNFKRFQAVNPDVFCGTGPYKLANLTQTQMLLTKNEDYYLADKIPFNRILAENISDLSTTYSKLKTGELDYQDGFAPNATLDEIISSNQDMVHIKAYDPASVGILFNFKNSKWTDGVRKAFQYIFDREEVKNASNKYAVANYYGLSGVVSTEAKKFLSEEDFNNLPTYRHDEAEATRLLQEAGWTKSGNQWNLPGGEKASFTLGYDGSNSIMSSTAEAVQGALNSFGIEVRLSRASDWGTWYQKASSETMNYDFVVNWTELGLSFAHPKGCYDFFFNDQNGPIIHFPRITMQDVEAGYCQGYEVGGIKLDLPKHNGEGTFKAYEYLEKLYCLNNTELKEATADLIYGVASLNSGVALFRNVSGGFYSKKAIPNLPQSEYWKNGNRNVTVIPEVGTTAYFDCARISVEFANEAALLYGYGEQAK